MADQGIPPPPPESALFGGNQSAPPPPPPEGALYGNGPQTSANAPPPPPPEDQLFGHVAPPKTIGGYVDQIGHDLHGAYMGAVMGGFGGFVARHIYSDVLGVPKDQVNAAVQKVRQDAATEQQQNAFNVNIPNPFSKTGSTAVDPMAFGAGVVGGADPTYLIGPGEAVAKSAFINGITNTALRTTARVGANAAAHAAMMSAADATYQTADQIDGLQQGFDVKRNLQAAAAGAGFGTVMGGVHEAAPFIQQLYKSRNGIDTTPSENPTGGTNPLSDQGLNPQQAAEYAEVLKTGNQSDIHNFFNDKNVVPPTHSAINDFVSRRDGTTPLSDMDPDTLVKTMMGTPDNTQVVQDHIKQITDGWANPPDVEVINHTDDIQDPKVQAEAKAAGADDPSALGFYGSDGKVRIFANKMTSAEDINAALYHEGLGHAGLANQFGDKLDSTLNTLMNRNVGQFGMAVSKELKENGSEYGNDPTRAAEEVLANMSEKGPLPKSVGDALQSVMRQFGRKMGVNLSYNDAEVRNILAMVHDSMVNGNGRDVAANGFSMRSGKRAPGYQATDLSGNADNAPTTKFMFTGKKATGFDGDQGFVAPDGHARNEISDEDARLRAPVHNGLQAKLPDVLDHPELYRQYPQLRDINVSGVDTKGELNGFYAPNTRTIGVDHTSPDQLGTILHETQHVIQHIEGHASGATPDVNARDYNRSFGEIEARSTEARRGLSDADRQYSDPYASQGIDPKDMLVSGPFKTRIERMQEAAQAKPTYDGMQTPEQLAERDKVPTTAEWEAEHGPYVAQPHEFPQTEPYKPGKDPVGDGFMTKEQLDASNKIPTEAEAYVNNPVRFMRKSDMAADKDYVGKMADETFRVFDQSYVKDTRSFAEIKRAALAAGISPSQIKDLGAVGDLSVKLHRLQAAANMTDMKLAALHEKMDTPEWNPVTDQGHYLQVLADHELFVQKVLGTRSEIGRALNVSKMATSYSIATMKQVADRLREEGSGLASLADDPVKFMKFAQNIKALMNGGNKAAAHVKIAGVNKPYWEDYLTSMHFSMMLSRLATQAKSITDMSNGTVRDVLDHVAALPIGAIRQAIAGGKALPGLTWQRVYAHTYGILNRAIDKNVWEATIHAAKTGENQWVIKGLESTPAHFGTISQTRANLGPIVGLPGNLVSAHDTFFRALNMSGHLWNLAMQKAQGELGPNAALDDLMTRASAHAYSPTFHMLKTAKANVNQTLLLNSNPLNQALDMVKAQGMGPGATVPQRIKKFMAMNLIPFPRVEMNSLWNRVIQRSPLAFLDPSTLKQLKAGGESADMALARIAVGTGSLMLAVAGANKLTGEVSQDYNKSRELLAAGETRDSVHENGVYNQGNNLPMSAMPWDLHNSTAQMVKSAMDAYKQGSHEGFMNGMKLSMYSITSHLMDMTWASTIAPYIDTLTSNQNMEQKAASVAADQAKTWVPGILDQAEKMTDHQRDIRPDRPGALVQSVGRAMQSAIPGLAEGLPAKNSVYGQPLDTGQSFEGTHTIIRGLSGNRTPDPTDPGIVELNRLAKLSPAAVVTPTPRTLSIEGAKVPLTTAQAEEYQQKVGQTIVEATKSAMSNPNWQSATDKDKIAYVKEVQKEARQQIKETLLTQQGWLNSKQIDGLRTYASGKQ
jgi:hypothetical protein